MVTRAHPDFPMLKKRKEKSKSKNEEGKKKVTKR
jgi:hypothetical protein